MGRRPLRSSGHACAWLRRRAGEQGGAGGLVGLAEGFADAVREELDFTPERDNLTAIAAFLASASRRAVRVTVPDRQLSTERVLVMQRLAGTPLGSAELVLRALDPRAGPASLPRCS